MGYWVVYFKSGRHKIDWLEVKQGSEESDSLRVWGGIEVLKAVETDNMITGIREGLRIGVEEVEDAESLLYRSYVRV